MNNVPLAKIIIMLVNNKGGGHQLSAHGRDVDSRIESGPTRSQIVGANKYGSSRTLETFSNHTVNVVFLT